MHEPLSFLPTPQELVECVEGKQIHREMLPDFTRLCDAAKQAGFDLVPISAYRSVEDQLVIWNAKATGKRKLVSDTSEVLDASLLDEESLMFAILRFSALPGGSRHHWGSDIDVIDASALTADYNVQLSLEETCGEGIFNGLHRWLDQMLAQDDVLFFRPYGPSAIGEHCVAEEPWHLSYTPIAERCQHALTKSALETLVLGLDIELKTCVLDHIDVIYNDYCSPAWK